MTAFEPRESIWSRPSLLERPVLWGSLATLMISGWAFLFWYVVLVGIGYEHLGIGLGEGGVVYPVIFLPLVLTSSGMYEAVLGAWFARQPASRAARLAWSLWLPSVTVAVLLAVYCPTDGASSFIEQFGQKAF